MEAVRLPALTKLEQKRLEELLPEEPIEILQETLAAERHGEPLTIAAIIAISVPALGAIALWASRSTRDVTVERIETSPDGTTVTNRYTVRSREALSADTTRALADMFRVDYGALSALIAKWRASP